MNINRNNYEEYFLLYADNELSQTEKKVVEIFVQENVDLKEEFLTIQLTVNASDEEVKLLDKSFLIKEEPPFININNYEEVFVLYHDNELSPEQKKEAEQFVSDQPKFNIDFELIGKSKLSPDENIIFAAKAKLYKKEKSGKVVPLILWRSIAAAVFIGFGLWGSISYLNKQEGMRAVAVEGKTIKSLITTEEQIVPEEKNNIQNIAIAQEPKEQNENEEKFVNRKEEKFAPERKEEKNTLAKSSIKNNPAAVEKVTDGKQADNNNYLLAANIPVKEPSKKIDASKAPILPEKPVPHIDKYDETIQPQTVVESASYAVDQNNSNDENYVFYNVKAEEFKKSKVGGFLKKVKRIVERSNPITRLLSADEKQVASN